MGMDRREVKGIKEAVRLRGVTHPISPPPEYASG